MGKPNTQYVFVYDDKRYNIEDIHFNISQKQEDRSGKPVTRPRHSPILLYLTPMGKNKDRELVQQYVSKRLFDGHIEFLIIEDGIENRLMRHLEFANAKLSRFGLSTQYPGHEGKEILRIEISAYIVKHGDTIMEWANNPSNPFKVRNTPITRREEREEGSVHEMYTTDINGKRVSDYDIGDRIIVVIKSTGKIGDIVTIDLTNKTKDFKYNGVPLENDMLEYQIKTNENRIELEVIPEQE